MSSETLLSYIKLDFFWRHDGTWGMQNTLLKHHRSPTALNVEDELLASMSCGLDQWFPTPTASELPGEGWGFSGSTEDLLNQNLRVVWGSFKPLPRDSHITDTQTSIWKPLP